MKAWEDIESEKGSKLYTTSYSRYWIDSGIKIEKMNTGEVVVRDFLCHGDYSEQIQGRELKPFLVWGWEVGVRVIRLKHLEKDLHAQEKASVFDITKRDVQKRKKKMFKIQSEIRSLIRQIKILKDGK